MNMKGLLKIVRESNKRRIRMLSAKGHDYANNVDTFGNFDRLAKICKLMQIDVTMSEGTCLFYILIKLDRLSNLIINNKTPFNEPVEDTLSDMQNYIDLLRGILAEKKESVKK